jgi:hypothetical protein
VELMPGSPNQPEKKAFKHQCELRLLVCEPNPFRPDRVTVGFLLRDTNPENPRVEVCLAPKLSAIQCVYPNADLEAIEGTLLEMEPILKNVTDFEHYLQNMPFDAPAEFSFLPGTALLTDSIEREIELLTNQYLVRLEADAGDGKAPARRDNEIGRAYILRKMQEAFTQYGVWNFLQKDIPVAAYTFKNDQQKIDFAYRSYSANAYRMFHAVSVVLNLDKAKLLAYSCPEIRAHAVRDGECELFGIVEDAKFCQNEASVAAMEFMQSKGVIVRPVSSIMEIAANAAAELRV